MTNQQHRLYRNQTNKVFAGVCSGLGEYLNVDTIVIRLVWILLTLLGGAGIIAYILACFIIPKKPIESSQSTPLQTHDFTAVRIFGFLFVGAGVAILLDNLDILSFHRWWHMSWEFVFPGLLILAGIYFLTKRDKISTPQQVQEPSGTGEPSSQDQIPPTTSSSNEQPKTKALRRSIRDKKLFGICGGVGEYFDVDPTIIRIAYAIFTILSGGAGILIYLLMYLIIPEGQPQVRTQK
ncbi:MAG: PspC domain-containing protein [Bacteroidota bacterium]|jgi:phage shock protein C